ncbi:MAG TPA: dTMP kinase [Bacteroidota bacterium]|nr:dTMP kinase [Bacteroidota bacterium]
MFITFEGLDFSGKSTQANLLVERLKKAKHVVHFLREPGGTKISERVREILLDRSHLEMTEAAELLLFSASRTQLVAEVIVPALQRGEIVVCDRYYDSTTAYQGYGRGFNLEAVRHINKIATAGTDPDLTILVDIPVEEIERRKAAAGMTFDRMESAGREFYERVRKGYLDIARNEPDRLVLVDGLASIDAVKTQVWQAVERRKESTIK